MMKNVSLRVWLILGAVVVIAWSSYEFFRSHIVVALNKSNAEESAQTQKLSYTNTKEQLIHLLSSSTNEIGTPVIMTGSLAIFHSHDDLQDLNASRYEYYLQIGNKRYDYYPLGANIEALSGSKVSLTGYHLGKDIVFSAANSQALKIISTPTPMSATGPQRVLAIPVRWKSAAEPRYTLNELRDWVFKGEVKKFYKEASYGNMEIVGDLLPKWYTLEKDGCQFINFQPDDPSSDNIYKLIKNDVDVRNYDRLVFLMNGACDPGSATAGTVSVPLNGEDYIHSETRVLVGTSLQGAGAYFPHSGAEYVFAHEFGHNLGVAHANRIDCESDILYGRCVHVEYGSFYDIMAGGRYGSHQNAVFKDVYGWTKGKSLRISKSGTYIIYPYELGKCNISAIIRNPALPDASYYGVEFRNAIGYDGGMIKDVENTKGLMINWANNNPLWPETSLLDMEPGNPKVTVLLPGKIFEDKGRGIRIKALNTVNSDSLQKTIALEVKISKPVCVENYPLMRGNGPKGVWDQPVEVSAGSNLSLYYSFQNMDSPTCSSSLFEHTVIFPAGWPRKATDTDPVDDLVPPDGNRGRYNKTGYLFSTWFNEFYSFSIPLNTPAGRYTIPITVRNVTSGKEVTHTIILDVSTVAVFPPTLVNPTCAASGTVSWTGAPRSDYTFTVRMSTVSTIPNDDRSEEHT